MLAKTMNALIMALILCCFGIKKIVSDYENSLVLSHYAKCVGIDCIKLLISIVAYCLFSGADKKKVKASRHWPLLGETTGDRWLPLTEAGIAENVSIWWRHHVCREHFSVMKSLLTTYYDTFLISAFLCLCTSKTWCHSSPVALASSIMVVSSMEASVWTSARAGGCRKFVSAKWIKYFKL